MSQPTSNNRILMVMDLLGLSATALSRASGIDASIISKWRRGNRQLTARSQALQQAACALLQLDTGGLLQEYYLPHRSGRASDEDALVAFLLSEELPALIPRTAPPTLPTSGDYTVEYRVFLGRAGFQRAAMVLLDYVQLLPAGQTVTVLCQGRYEWFTRNLAFTLQFLDKLKEAIGHGVRLQVVNRKGYAITEAAAFAGHWLKAHLNGYIRSLYYEGQLPGDVRFVGSIPGYWSARAQADPTVEDNLYLGMYTDPRETRKDAALCGEYLARSRPACQYAFFSHPLGNDENQRLWGDDIQPPPWKNPGAKAPDGSFHALCRVPGIALGLRSEAITVAGPDTYLYLPRYMLSDDGVFAPAPHKIILCREDVQAGLAKARRMHEVFSTMLHRRAFVPRDMLAAQLRRLLNAMEQREDFEVALMPRTAFENLGLEMVSWHNSVTIGWLPNMKESVFCDDEATAGSFYEFIEHTWERLHKGWKRKDAVARTLRRWLAGKGLDAVEKDSAMVQNWSVLPGEGEV